MTVYTAALDFTAALSSPESCPACGYHGIAPVTEQGVQNFRCPRCLRCWHPTLRMMVVVDPAGCVECGHRAECLAVELRDS